MPHAGKNQPAPPVSFRLRAFGTDSRRVRYTRIAAHTVGGSAAWLLQRTGKTSVPNRLAGAIVMAPGGLSDVPQSLSGILGQLHREENTGLDHKALAATIVALRTADAVIAGPFSAEDANTPGMVAHLADLARGSYRALRPPRELLVQAGFGQIARRFQFILISHREARTLAAGAIDIGILAQRLRQLRGESGEFAITKFSGHGLLWAENRLWEIDPIGGNEGDEERAGAAFCTAWVVARGFLEAPAAKALSYARSAAANSILKK